MDVSYRDRPNEHFEGELKELFGLAEKAIDDGAEKVVVYPIFHSFAGGLRRCETCGGLPGDRFHQS